MDTILEILGCLFAGVIISFIIFAIIGSRNYENNFNKSLLVSTIIIGIVIFGLDFMYQSKISELENMIDNANSLNELQLNLEEKNIEMEE